MAQRARAGGFWELLAGVNKLVRAHTRQRRFARLKYPLRRMDLVLFLAGLATLGFILALPAREDADTYLDHLRGAASVLRDQILTTDVTTDILGFRALFYGTDPYAPIAVAAKTAGIEWDVSHASTHPPTAYLLVAPVALWPLTAAIAIWSWAMLGLVIAGFRCLGLSWEGAIGAGLLSLLWPPTSPSLAQLTPIWFFAVTWVLRDTKPKAAGVIALASFTKFYPAMLM